MMMLLCMAGISLAQAQTQKIQVEAGNAESLLAAIHEANQKHDGEQTDWLYIMIPNGTYDLGEQVLTTLTANHVALKGESMEGTIIKNQPPVENEGISTTATLRIIGSDNYLQDLTLLNALDYSKTTAAGRGVCLQDKGTRTICKRVRLLSNQDTYYSDNETGQMYFEDSEIHGTVDFICGAGDVTFNRCTLVTERRNSKGRCVIAAPRTSKTHWGYVFLDCTIRNNESPFLYARGWRVTPKCTWIRTKLLTPEKLGATRFDTKGMRTIDSYFKEYGTLDANGQLINPDSNVLTLTLKDEKNTVETVLSKKDAKRYTVKNIYGKWQPEKIARKLERCAGDNR